MKPLHLFQGYGIECEFMLVDKRTLAPLHISDRVLTKLAGELTQEVELGQVAWSNELVMHVLELKANGPHPNLSQLHKLFAEQIRNVNALLAEDDACLLPTAMHPLMNPLTDTKLWPHGDKIIYETYNQIFGCQGHGWSNLQSVHINLPFANDEEFGRLHAAIRMVLPILPALAASSPIVEGKHGKKLDQRLCFYKNNQMKIPSITGQVIPEAFFSEADYSQGIFKKIMADIAPFDPHNVMEEQWLNSRGAIARFDRNAIEIRVLDIQECLRGDFAVIAAVVSLVHAFVDQVYCSYEEQKTWDTAVLAGMFNEYLENGSSALIKNKNYLKLFGVNEECSYLMLWQKIGESLQKKNYPLKDHYEDFQYIANKGNLAMRILESGKLDEKGIIELYQRLATCLAKDQFL